MTKCGCGESRPVYATPTWRSVITHRADASTNCSRPRRCWDCREGWWKRHQSESRRPSNSQWRLVRQLPPLPSQPAVLLRILPTQIWGGRLMAPPRSPLTVKKCTRFMGQSSFATHVVCHDRNMIRVLMMRHSKSWGLWAAALSQARAPHQFVASRLRQIDRHIWYRFRWTKWHHGRRRLLETGRSPILMLLCLSKINKSSHGLRVPTHRLPSTRPIIV